VKRLRYILATLFVALAFARSAVADQLDDFAHDFWAWRAVEQPFSGDDIPRIERLAGWTPDWSAAAVARRRGELASFEERWQQLKSEMDGAPVPRQVDYRLVGSALARVRWELDVSRDWQRDPAFTLRNRSAVSLSCCFRRRPSPGPAARRSYAACKPPRAFAKKPR